MAITKPYTFQAGAKARASEVNRDFDILYEEVNRIGTEILNIDIEIQNVAEGKADINGNAGQVFKMANPKDSYDGVNKNFLENAIANMKEYISGFIISKDTDTSIIVSPGSCYDSTFTVVINSTGNITKENTIQGAGTRYVHAISDNSGRQVDILISSQSINPGRPSDTKYRLIGSIVVDSNNKITSISYFGNKGDENKNTNYITGIVIPDYTRGINVGQSFTAPNDGVYVITGGKNNSTSYFYVNDVQVLKYLDGSGVSGRVDVSYTILLAKGDVCYWNNTLTTSFSKFFPLKGDK